MTTEITTAALPTTHLTVSFREILQPNLTIQQYFATLKKHFLLFLLYVRENGLENIITLVKGKAEAVTLPVEKVRNFFDLKRIQREAPLYLFSLDLNAEEL